MKKMTDKQKRIIAYIIAIWFAIFGTIGMVQTGLNIANCAGRKKETKKAYAAESAVIETTTFRFNLANIYKITTNTKESKKIPTIPQRVASLANLTINYDSNISNVTVTTSKGATEQWANSGNTIQNTISFENNCIWQVYTTNGYVIDKIIASDPGTSIIIMGDNYFTGTYIAGGQDETLTITSKRKTEPTPPSPTGNTTIEQNTQQIEFIFTANSITIQIYNANRETTYIGQWQGTTEDGWTATIGSYNTKLINGTTVQQREGFSINLSPQNISALSGQIQPTYIPTKAEMTIYENQIKFKFGLESTTEESEYIQIQINQNDPTINFIPENTIYQNSLNTTGYTQGYQDGFKQGEQEKEIYGITQYNKGKNDGIASANKYTFKGLISAVFDVPIQTLYGMLDFNILGINILSLIMSIVSVILLIAIVKVLL